MPRLARGRIRVKARARGSRIGQTDARLDRLEAEFRQMAEALRDLAAQQLLLGRYVKTVVDRHEEAIDQIHERVAKVESRLPGGDWRAARRSLNRALASDTVRVVRSGASVWAVVVGLVAEAGGAPLRPGDVPEPLRPWIAWALAGQEERLCPFLHGRGEARCAWPGRLDLALDDRGGRFSQTWRVLAPAPAPAPATATGGDAWAPLPGDDKRWPLDLRVDGRPAAVVARDGVPHVRLPPGDHAVAGAFAWAELPESLPVPPDTGVVALALRGRPVALPSRDAEGSVWLQPAAAAVETEERLDLVVHRRVIDEVPPKLHTRVEIRASGRSREVLLGRALPPGFVPMSLGGALPARLERDGRLRVQVRAGEFALDLVARHDGPAAALVLAKAGGDWADEEVWVFDARPDLRQVAVEGVPAIDPQQTTLPDDWKRLPAYRLAPGDTMKLHERRRGDADPAPDQLVLRRGLWLDFDGEGITARDQITGTLRRAFRLEAAAGTELGRVAVGGVGQLITRSDGARAGVEVRQGQLSVEADSRVRRGGLSATGWDHDFSGMSAVLHVAPGWRLLHVFGADDAPGTWIRRWTLLDLFLGLIVALAVGRLFGARWGALALATMALVFQEADAPRWIWLFVLGAEAIVRLLPAGRLRRVVAAGRIGAWLVLALLAVPFVATQVRAGLHPQLEDTSEEPGWSFASRDAGGLAGAAPQTPAPAAAPAEVQLEGSVKEEAETLAGDIGDEAKRAYGSSLAQQAQAAGKSYYRRQRLQQIDPLANVQTGPGVPSWSWTSYAISFSGPVARGQTLGLLLVPPWAGRLLSFARAALFAALVLCVLGVRWRARPGSSAGPGGAAGGGAGAAAVAAVALLLLPTASRADLPPADMLETLRERLLERPDCAPSCASAGRLLVEATPASLRARLEVGATAPTAVPIPGGSQAWMPERVLVDGAPARGLASTPDGVLWALVDAGAHQITLEGPLPARDVVQVPLPLRPHRVEVRASGWIVRGVDERGVPDDNLQLERVREAGAAGPGEALEPGALPPFVEVTRTLMLGLKWEVETRVRRLTPPGAAIVLDVPLLPGESVTTAEVRVEGGRAVVSMGTQAGEIAWESTLGEARALDLVAPTGVAWTEVWRLDAGPTWHVVSSGPPFVHAREDEGARVPTYRPWPGEKLALAITRPAPIEGRTLTIDRAALTLRPGVRATDATLALSLRSSRGGVHAVTLPPGVELQSVAIDGATQPIRLEGGGGARGGRRVALPVTPGRHEAQIAWRERRGISTRFSASDVDLGAPGVNAAVTIELPAGRWALLLGGPRLGPAVLFWSLLVALLAVAAALSRISWSPLRLVEWLLLGVGLSQVPVVAAAAVAGWLLALAWRRRRPPMRAAWFDLFQIALVGWTAAAAAILFAAIREGLLGTPQMQIEGNGSYYGALHWFDDRVGGEMPRPWILSVPIFVYRLAMLAWALWLAAALLRWLRFAWASFTEGGAWRRLRRTLAAPPAGSAPPAAPAP